MPAIISRFLSTSDEYLKYRTLIENCDEFFTNSYINFQETKFTTVILHSSPLPSPPLQLPNSVPLLSSTSLLPVPTPVLPFKQYYLKNSAPILPVTSRISHLIAPSPYPLFSTSLLELCKKKSNQGLTYLPLSLQSPPPTSPLIFIRITMVQLTRLPSCDDDMPEAEGPQEPQILASLQTELIRRNRFGNQHSADRTTPHRRAIGGDNH